MSPCRFSLLSFEQYSVEIYQSLNMILKALLCVKTRGSAQITIMLYILAQVSDVRIHLSLF